MTGDLRTLPPRSEQDYAEIGAYLQQYREVWARQLAEGERALIRHLTDGGHRPVAGHVPALSVPMVRVHSRLKRPEATVAKMRRFGEPLSAMLDVFGFRVVVADTSALDLVAGLLAELWETPAPEELVLRGGALRFAWWRDYRTRNHAGVSAATSDRYDEAVHLNRRAPFGICEIQTMTEGLYQRAVVATGGEEAHLEFAARRQRLFKHQDDEPAT